MKISFYRDTPAMRELPVRLCVLGLFFYAAIVLRWNFDPAYPILALPWAIVVLGIVGYAAWTLCKLWIMRASHSLDGNPQRDEHDSKNRSYPNEPVR